MGNLHWRGDTFIDPVVFDQCYVQVAMCYKSGANAYNTYYWNWPDTTTNTVAWVGPPYSPGPNPAIIVGGAPWNPGHEVWNGVMRGFQFYDVALTPSEIAQEIAGPGSVRRSWYLDLNPTPTDISDEKPERPSSFLGGDRTTDPLDEHASVAHLAWWPALGARALRRGGGPCRGAHAGPATAPQRFGRDLG